MLGTSYVPHIFCLLLTQGEVLLLFPLSDEESEEAVEPELKFRPDPQSAPLGALPRGPFPALN